MLHCNIPCECYSARLAEAAVRMEMILLWWFLAEVSNLPRLFCCVAKKLDALQQKHLPYLPDIVWMLFFSTPSFGGYWPGSRTPAFLWPHDRASTGNFSGVDVLMGGRTESFLSLTPWSTSMTPQSQHPILLISKPLVFTASLLPLAWMVWLGWQDRLGTNPVEALSHHTGDWSLRFLLLTLAVTPLRRLTGWNRPQQFRRMLGLFAFFYVCLHASVYLVFDQFFDWRAIVEDVVKRPYLTVGFAAWLLLIPLAVTSTRGMIRRLGRNWQRLHRLIYLIGVLGVLHYLWLVKTHLNEPLIYAGILALLLGYRLWWWARRSYKS